MVPDLWLVAAMYAAVHPHPWPRSRARHRARRTYPTIPIPRKAGRCVTSR